MSFEVYNSQNPTDNPVRLTLVKESDGDITIYSVGDDGKPVNRIISIQRDGTLYRWATAQYVSGLTIDGFGQIKLDD